MSSLLAGSLTLKSAGSTVAAPLTSAAGPESSEDMARREMDSQGHGHRAACDCGSPSHIRGTLFPSPRVRSGSRETRHSVYALQSKHPTQTNRVSCLHTVASVLRKFRHISSLRRLLCSLDKALFTGDVAKRIIIYRRLLFPRGNLLNTQICICCFVGGGINTGTFFLLLSASNDLNRPAMTTLPAGNRLKCLSPALWSDAFTPCLRRYQTTQHLGRRVGRIWWESHLTVHSVKKWSVSTSLNTNKILSWANQIVNVLLIPDQPYAVQSPEYKKHPASLNLLMLRM